MLTKLHITSLVIVNALAPSTDAASAVPVLNRDFTPIAVPPAAVKWALANLGALVGRDGVLTLFFPGCHAMAAPFVLFRLKRQAYSNCSAVASAEGLLVRATR